MKQSSNKSMMSYYRTLYGKYGVDDAYLGNRSQRRVTGAFLEQVDLQCLNPGDALPLRLRKKIKRAYRHSPSFKMLAASVTAAALLSLLQAPPVNATVGAKKTPYTGFIEQLESGYQSVQTDEDSFVTAGAIQRNGDQNLSLHLMSSEQHQNPAVLGNNVLLIDDDSDFSALQTSQRNLTVIDTSVDEWQKLAEAVNNGEVLLLDGAEHPLESIIDKLSEMGGADAINIISHGNSGRLLIDGRAISSESLEQEGDKWQKIGRLLSRDGDIKLYGCNVAQGEEGQNFIKKLAALTGADIAASINPTGNISKGGDWELEVFIGEIDENEALRLAQLKKYAGVLVWGGTIDFSEVKSAGQFDGPANINAEFYNDTGKAYTLIADGEQGAGYAVGGRGYGYKSTPSETKLTLSFSEGETFDPSQLYLFNCSGSDKTFKITSDRNDTETSNSLANSSGENVSLVGFTGVSKLYITNNAGGAFLCVGVDNLVMTNLQPPASYDADGTLTVGGGVSEPVAIPTTADTIGEAVDVFDFTITDGGTSDTSALTVSEIVLNTSGTGDFSKVTWRVDGPDASDVAGTYSGGGNTITFSPLSVSVADGANETYTVNAYFNDNTGHTEGQTFIVSVDGDTDLTIGASGTQMGSTSPVTNTPGSTVDVTATALSFTTQPGGSDSGFALTTQPVVKAVDAGGNVDTNFSETITLTEASAGTLTNNTQAASSGVSTFTNVIYTATADGQSFTLTANDQDGLDSDLPTTNANSVNSNVVATKLLFSTEPSPTSVNSGQATAFTTVPLVSTVDANDVVDTGYSTAIILAEVNGAGSATMTCPDDTDGSGATVTLLPTAGVSTFTDLNIIYTASGGSNETFNLQASSGGLTTGNSAQLTGVVDSTPPTITDGNISISGASGTGGAYKVGDTVTANWNNTAGGDNNGDVNTVTVDFSQFGGGSSVSASNSSETWTATYTITEDGGGSIDATNRNVSITATDNASNSDTVADSSNATVDNDSPVVTDANLSISGGSGTGGAFIVGDTVTAAWNNSAGGDNNSDTISSVTVNFSQFGGGATVAASNSSDTWTATYTITEDGGGSIDGTNLNVSVTATDNASNTTTTADTTNAIVDNDSPVVTDANISISGGSGNGSAFIVGDTVTAVWNNTAGGDNNSDTISSVTVNFSQFGGGAAVAATNSSETWTATYTITEDGGGSIDGTNLNVSVTATDNASNTTATADTTNATVDNDSLILTDGNLAINGASGNGGAFIAGDTVTATWNNTAGGDNNGDTVSSVTVDFSAFGGGSAIVASNSSETWTVSYSILSGSIDGTNLNIASTATDNAGNTTTTTDSTNATVDNQGPTISDANISISGGSGNGGAFIVGDTVTAAWNNSAGGDNNSDTISSVTVNFSQFGGGAAVAASNSSDTWTATYTITEDGGGSIDGTNFNVSVTATDNASNTTTTADTTNAIVDNDSPVVTDANISISGGSGNSGAFIVGDTVTAAWNNSAGGDNNSDTISSVSVNFSQFGGSAAVAASNSSDTWTATYTITEDGGGSIDGTNRNVSVTATDNGSNETSTADTTNAIVDNDSPILTDGNLSINGASGSGGTFITGDAVTATWDNTAGGDNNGDTISSVTVDFSAFGGGSSIAASNTSETWTASYSITSGSIDGTNFNIASTAADNAGNTTTTADSTNATVDNQGPTITDANISISGGSGNGGAFIVGDTVTATWNNTAGGDNNTGISSVTVNFSDFGGSPSLAATNGSDTWMASYSIIEGAGGGVEASNQNISITATDNVGNSTTGSDSTNANVDNVSPAAPSTPDMTAGTDTGTSDTDNVTSDTTPTFIGTSGANETIELTSSVDGQLATVTANGTGNWSVTPSSALTSTNHTIIAVASDDTGNSSFASSGLAVSIDNSVPAVPSTPDMTAITDNGVSTTDNKTSDTTPIFQGTAEIGSLVTLNSSVNGQIGSATVDGSGNWEISSTSLDYGNHNITAKSMDSSGNEALSSAALAIVINHDPSFTGTPAITGSPEVDTTLSLTDTGTTDIDVGDSVTLSYQWLQDDTIITGATSDTYRLISVDKNTSITCELTARDLNGGETTFTTSSMDVGGGFPWEILIPALSSPNKVIGTP